MNRILRLQFQPLFSVKRALLILPVFFLVLTSFKKDKADPDAWFELKAFEKSFVSIPELTFTVYSGFGDNPVSEEFDDHLFQAFYESDRQNVYSQASFAISKYEVSNVQYREFLSALKESDTALYTQMLPDTLVWNIPRSYTDPYIGYYLRHPAYNNFPVVGISYYQAVSYCEWLTAHYKTYPKRKHHKVIFRLPTLKQWVVAAYGSSEFKRFPWEGSNMQDETGNWLANFKVVDQSSVVPMEIEEKDYSGKLLKRNLLVGRAGDKNPLIVGMFNHYTDFEILLPVEGLAPNAYGLHNMAGNVEELVREPGICKGGSWLDTGFFLRNNVHQSYDSGAVSYERGFRIVMEEVD